MTLRHLAVLAAVSVLTAPGIHAQAADSSAFRRGQWGAEFNIGSGFAAAGLIKFKSPTSAWLFDVSAEYQHSTQSDTTSIDYSTDNVSLSLRPGLRRYRSLGRSVQGYSTAGLAFIYNWRKSGVDSAQTRQRSLGGGIFGDVGATWLVTPHLGLGAKFGASIDYVHSAVNTANQPTTWQLRVTFGTISLAGQLYF